MRNQLSVAILAGAIFSVMGLGAAWGQTPAQPKKPEWKDRAEYDLVQSIDKEQDPKKKIELLNQWKDKYPNTDFKVSRLEQYLNAYRLAQDPVKMMDAAQDILKEDPKNINGLYWTCLLVVGATDKEPAKLDLGEKAGKTVLDSIEEIFGADKKPAGTADSAWADARKQSEIAARRGLGWVYMTRKNLPDAEKQLTESLKLNPNDGQASYWLANVIRSGQKPERTPEYIFHFARAAVYDGAGALPADRPKVLEYTTGLYNRYHGEDAEGLKQLLALAKTQVFPPAGFEILSKEKIEEMKLKKLAESNPSLPLWLKLKEALTSADGTQYFDSGMKDAVIPPEGQPLLQGTVISQEGLRSAKKVLVGIENPKVADCTLNFEVPLPGKAEPGTIIKFRGVASAFTKEPFMVTFAAEKKDVTGWPAPPPPAKKAPVHKAAKKK